MNRRNDIVIGMEVKIVLFFFFFTLFRTAMEKLKRIQGTENIRFVRIVRWCIGGERLRYSPVRGKS